MNIGFSTRLHATKTSECETEEFKDYTRTEITLRRPRNTDSLDVNQRITASITPAGKHIAQPRPPPHPTHRASTCCQLTATCSVSNMPPTTLIATAQLLTIDRRDNNDATHDASNMPHPDRTPIN